MKWFLGTWYPTNSDNQELYAHTTYRPDGTIVHNTGWPPTEYKMVAEHDSYVVLLANKSLSPKAEDNERFYTFLVLVPHYSALSEGAGLPGMIEERRCNGRAWGDRPEGRSWRLTKEDFDLPLPEIKALWDRFAPCNPTVGNNRASERFPWGRGWSWRYFTSYLPIEDHARQAGLTELPDEDSLDMYRYYKMRGEDIREKDQSRPKE